jgi:hypothetical protein
MPSEVLQDVAEVVARPENIRVQAQGLAVILLGLGEAPRAVVLQRAPEGALACCFAQRRSSRSVPPM